MRLFTGSLGRTAPVSRPSWTRLGGGLYLPRFTGRIAATVNIRTASMCQAYCSPTGWSLAVAPLVDAWSGYRETIGAMFRGGQASFVVCAHDPEVDRALARLESRLPLAIGIDPTAKSSPARDSYVWCYASDWCTYRRSARTGDSYTSTDERDQTHS